MSYWYTYQFWGLNLLLYSIKNINYEGNPYSNFSPTLIFLEIKNLILEILKRHLNHFNMKIMYQVSMHQSSLSIVSYPFFPPTSPRPTIPRVSDIKDLHARSTKLLCLTLGVLLINKEPTN